MNKKSLMVGDWVQLKTYGVSDKFERTEAYMYVKVAEIGSGLITVEYNNDIKEPYRICENTEIEPIPLTAEILEKNGIKLFCTEPSGRKTYCCNEPTVHCTYIPNSGWLINVGACGSIKVRFVEISKIQYVHELQHALRLCGISKEIEL